jgi:hypothetical protein
LKFMSSGLRAGRRRTEYYDPYEDEAERKFQQVIVRFDDQERLGPKRHSRSRRSAEIRQMSPG